MKKFLTTILTIFAVLFLFGSAYAGPEQVSIVPISKWNYKNVNGYGLYAKGGEYSWFAFILRNAGNTDVTVTLPSEVDVAHNTRHKIVNTAYKAMYNGSVDINYSGYFKVYFTNSFTLPKDSTYSVFFDVTDIQPYNKQWDTDVFFSIQIKDQNTAINLPIKGVLAYDAKNTTPSRLTIVTQDPNQGTAAAGDPLTTVSFCRDLANNKVSFAYALKNNTAAVIPVELATSLAVEGQSGAVPVSYTGCTSGGSSCTSRISGGIFKLNPGETAEFKGEAALSAKPSKTDFYIQTSLRYDYNGQILTPFLVGYATGACSAGSPAPVPTPASPSTPETGTDELGLISTSFCRDYDANARRLSFSYTLKNSSSVQIPVELATSLAIEGQQNVVPLSYTGCTSGGSSCSSRISGGIFTMDAGETVEFKGQATLSAAPSKSNFYVRTSLRYNYKGRTLIPFLVGYAGASCSAGSTAPSATAPNVNSEGGLVNVSFCRSYDANARKITFAYALKNKSSVTIPVELATTLAVEGFNKVAQIRYTGCTSGGSSCSSRISKGIFKLNAGETAEFRGEATLPSNPANANFFIKTSLRYDYNGRTLIPFLVGYTTNTCSAAHAISADEVIQKSSESGDPFWFSARVINDRDSEMTILPGAVLRGEAAFGNYEGTAAISAVDVEITGHTDVPFRNDEAFILPPYSIADISISLSGPAASDEGLIWNYTIDGTAQSFELNEGRAKGLTLGDTKAAEPEEPLRFYAIGSTQNPGTIPDFEPKW
ncbi:MAG: hypothetical protein IJI07_03485 [Flexilinea sp.]|nr:hypothetical protein [Flexilinea sp.]